jgi:hypothetical protein
MVSLMHRAVLFSTNSFGLFLWMQFTDASTSGVLGQSRNDCVWKDTAAGSRAKANHFGSIPTLGWRIEPSMHGLAVAALPRQRK